MSSSSPSADWDALEGSSSDDVNAEATSTSFYRRTQLYTLDDWTLPAGGDLADYILAGARNGGPFALTRDDSRPVLLTTADAADNDGNGVAARRKKRVWIYSAAGTLQQTIVWDHTSRIAKIGFTEHESVVVLARDGIYRIYPLAEQTSGSTKGTAVAYSQHTLAHDIGGDATVSDARIYEGGMVVLLSSNRFLEVIGWPSTTSSKANYDRRGADSNTATGFRIERLAEASIDRPVSAWCILTPEQSTSRQVEVILSSAEHNLMSIDQLEVQNLRISTATAATPSQRSLGPFSAIHPSPSGRFLALLSSSSPMRLLVLSSNLAETLSEYVLDGEGEREAPRSVAWCGNNAVLLAWDSSLLLVGPYGHTLRYSCLDPVHVITELDGVRIVSQDKHDLLQKVPASTVAVFAPGSAHPAAILYEAYEQFNARDPRSYETIQAIRVDLVEAVDTCIDAAGKEFDADLQRRLLRAASYGKSFIDLYNPSDFVNTSRVLRVLNALRYYEIGIPLTYDQYTSESPEAVVSRLTLRNRHLLAIRICTFLKISAAPVLKHWANSRVLASKNDQEDATRTCSMIVKRLLEEYGKATIGAREVSCADVARTAWEEGKTVLATKLLEHEPRASKQVHLLLQMKEDNVALSKASRSGDSDLVLSVLLSLRKQHSLGTFFRFLDGKEEAIAILVNYGKRYDRELVRDFWFQDDRRSESACFGLEEAASITAPSLQQLASSATVKGNLLASAKAKEDAILSSPAGSAAVVPLSAEQFSAKMEKVRNAQKTFGEDKERGFETKMCDEHLRLLAFQQALQAELGSSAVPVPGGGPSAASHGSSVAGVPFVGLSLNDTIRQCIMRSQPKKADKLKTDFKVPEKRFWYIKLKALTEIRDWEALEAFSRSKKQSPIGYEPFVEHLVNTGNPRQALLYVARCEPRFRAELYVKAGEWARAGEDCRDRGDRVKLSELVQRAPNTIIAAQLSSLLEDTRTF